MMYKRVITLLCVFIVAFSFPFTVEAVDYTISDVTIEAYLQEDGTVDVEETFTYSYSGEFNGIIRTLNYRESSEIVNVEAFEAGESLEIETEEEIIHYIQRPGSDETITIDIHYTIENGIDIYEDMAQFYWPFFDSNNESDYESLTVIIYPPADSAHTVAIGYDEAENSEAIEEGGTVIFDMGEVSSGQNGDIRAAFDRELFPDIPAVTESGSLAEEINQEHEDREEQAATFASRQNTLSDVSMYLLPVIALIYLVLIFKESSQNRARKKAAAFRKLSSSDIPNLKMSMPATLLYLNYYQATAESLAASLLELVRKNKVGQLSDDNFELINTDGLSEHESILVSWLFHDIGDGKLFKFSDMTEYYKNENNYQHYDKSKAKWIQAVMDELKNEKLWVNKSKFRWLLGLSSLPVGIFGGVALFHHLLIAFIAALVIMLVPSAFALFYHPRTEKGWSIKEEWQSFNHNLSQMKSDDWQKWDQAEQMKAFVFGLGINNRHVKKIAEDLSQEIDMTKKARHSSTGFDSMPAFMASGLLFHTSFTSSASAASSSTGSGGSGVSVGGGTGVGGGGGGSGGF